MTCSISAPENPSLAAASFPRSNPDASRPRLFKCSANSAARTSAFGKSTKKISSNRPLRSISGGSTVMLFDVAARNTPLSRSCIHVSSVASRRCDNPASASPLEPAEANAFSISSIHNTSGASFCANSRALRRRRSLSPTYLSYSAPASSRANSNPHSPATARAAKLFPQPCTPVISTPFGGTKPNRRPSGVSAFLRFAIQSRRRRNPATSTNDASRRIVSINPSVFSASRFVSSTAPSNPASALPLSSALFRSARNASSSGKPTKFCASSLIAAASKEIGIRCSRFNSASTCITPANKSSAPGSPNWNGIASPSRSAGSSIFAAVSTIERRTARNFSAKSRSRRQILSFSQ